MQLSKYIDVCNVHITATTTDVLTVEADTQNSEGVMFIGFGTSALGTMVVQGCATTAGSYATLKIGTTSSYGTSAGKALAAVEVHKPAHRYLKATWTAAGNSYMGLMAIKYGLRMPTTAWNSTVGLPSTGGGCRSAVSPSST